MKDESEREYYHEFSNGIECWMRISMSGMTVKWSDENTIQELPNNYNAEGKAFLQEYVTFRNASLNDYAQYIQGNILVID